MSATDDVPDPRALLRKYGLSAKKSWGQNFLTNPRVYAAIVEATVVDDTSWVIEIGAGLGTLTARLASRARRVVAVERDRDMVAVLRGELASRANVDIVEDNALTFDYRVQAERAGQRVAVCGNLPYNIGSQILFSIIDQRDAVARAVVMLQREVADRLTAEPATPEYGALTALIQAWADVSTVTRAGPGSFHPAPRVDSTVVCIEPRSSPRAPIADAARYSDVVHAAFGQRRKTLRNALRARYDVDVVDRALAATTIDGRRRGETLAIEELIALANALESDAGAS